ARGLLLAFASQNGDLPASTHAASALLLEPLTEAEQRVLGLLARGRTNPEIAAALVVSINTVKTQGQSIYRKLNVNSRWEGNKAAHRLDLLGQKRALARRKPQGFSPGGEAPRLEPEVLALYRCRAVRLE